MLLGRLHSSHRQNPQQMAARRVDRQKTKTSGLTKRQKSCRVEPREVALKRTWTIIGVADVARSFKWYQSLFGQSETRPAHDDWAQLRDANGTVLLCLHQWGAHEHPSLTSPDRAQPGNGLLLFFRVDDFNETLFRARALVAGLEEEPHLNPSTGTNEFALRKCKVAREIRQRDTYFRSPRYFSYQPG